MTPITRTIRVIDEFGQPLYGAHVILSSTQGTTTNDKGIATITGDAYSKVRITFIGKTVEEHMLQNVPATVMLYEDFESLDAVVITSRPNTPSYLFPALGAAALLLVLMSLGGEEPKKVTL